ncbi:MAG TPA: HPr(Ser) kinase/phosphatase [Nitrospirota bacterium]
MNRIKVAGLVKACPDEIGLKVVAGGSGTRGRSLLPEIQKVGLALTGVSGNIDPRKIQVLGRSEMDYLRMLSKKKRREVINAVFEKRAAAYLVTSGNEPFVEMAEAADRLGVPLLISHLETIHCIRELLKALDELQAREVHLHGVLVDVMGVGVLILGPSGIGKSECALELVVRGHRFVADDVVSIRRLNDGRLVGSSSEIIRYHMEIRGLGIVNVRDMFGISAIKSRKTLDLVVELVRWEEHKPYDRLGIDGETYEIAGKALPFMRMPVTPGRNIAIIVEVAARNHALKAQGANAARSLDTTLTRRLAAGGKGRRAR